DTTTPPPSDDGGTGSVGDQTDTTTPPPSTDDGGTGSVGDQTDTTTPPSTDDGGTGSVGDQTDTTTPPPSTDDGGTGDQTAPVALAPGATVAVDGGRVTVFTVDATQDIASIQITNGPAQGNVTVNPDNSLALVLSGSDYSGALAFDFKITYANGTTEARSAALNVSAPDQKAGWGEGKHYMLETDAQGDLVIETGDNHRKVYVSGSSNALTAADIAARENVSESTITGQWLRDHPEYGGSEGKALATDIGMDLWYALHPVQAEPVVSSNWLMFEKGYTYENTGRLITAGTSGESPLQPIYISSWGSGARPVLTDQIRIFQLDSDNIVFDGLAPKGGIMGLKGSNIIVNDSEFTGQGVAFQYMEGITLRDSDLSHITVEKPAGPEWSGTITAAYIGVTDGVLMENNIFHHTGWEDDYRMDNSTLGGMPPNMFSHNVYFQNDTTDVTFRDNIVSQGASYGAQFRGGAFIEDNVFVDNNAAVDALGGDHAGAGPIGNYSFFADNLITSGAHKLSPSMGGLTLGLTDRGYDTAFLDNIIAHLADPANAGELAGKTVTHPAFQSENGIAYDDTIIYNWLGSGQVWDHVSDNGQVSDTARADATTIQNFAASLLGKDKATITEMMDAVLAGTASVTADDIIAYFQAGFGVAANGDGSVTEHRFIPNAIADGIRWDNRINWDSQELPDAGDNVDLGGNHVQYGGTTKLGNLDLGGGDLHVNHGKLTVDGTLSTSGAKGLIQTVNGGQFWTDGYAGAQQLQIDVDGGRFANTGNVTGKTLMQASDGQTLLATSGGSYTLTDGSQLTVDGSDARIGFDGANSGTAKLQMQAGGTLTFKGDAGGFSTIEEFRSGAWDQTGSPVHSSVTLDGTLQVDLSDYSGGAGSHTLIAVDELLGQLDEIKFVGLGSDLSADLVVDHGTDTVLLTLSAGGGQNTTSTVDDTAAASAPAPTEPVTDPVTDSIGSAGGSAGDDFSQDHWFF
ncbi:right-handed parallel beta-helix repeat-containing protein, partial [Sedimentitalea sp. HM32M-2]|uniref:right-handed parallel beta-helix repeat-containing protein n=1 Tax=Sedimentitalea sp. HM32M-2 TaxID=3351566 RepID=UPI0036402388